MYYFNLVGADSQQVWGQVQWAPPFAQANQPVRVLQQPAGLQVVLPPAAIKRLVVARALPKTPPESTEIGPESYQALNSDLRTCDVTRTLRLVLVNNRGQAGHFLVNIQLGARYYHTFMNRIAKGLIAIIVVVILGLIAMTQVGANLKDMVLVSVGLI